MADKPIAWNDIAKKLDPMMPQEQYDRLRGHFFDTTVAPNLPRGSAVGVYRQKFMSKTERPPLLTGAARALFPVVQAANSTVEALTSPLEVLPLGKPMRDMVKSNQASLDKVAARDGIGSFEKGAASLVGNIAGSLMPIGAEMKVAGALTEPLLKLATKNAATLALATRVAKGSLSFAAYNAMGAEDGKRFLSGAEGAAWGTAAELAFGSRAFFRDRKLLKSGAEELQADLLKGKPAPNAAIDEANVELMDKSLKASKKRIVEMRPDYGVTGVNLIAHDSQSRPFLQEVDMNKPESVEDALLIADMFHVNGGQLSSIRYHPDVEDQAKMFLAKLGEEYEAGQAQGIVIKVAGDAGFTAEQMRIKEGLPAVQVGPDKVRVIPEGPVNLKEEVFALERKGIEVLPEEDMRQKGRIFHKLMGLRHPEKSHLYKVQMLNELLPYRKAYPGIDEAMKYAPPQYQEKWQELVTGKAPERPEATKVAPAKGGGQFKPLTPEEEEKLFVPRTESTGRPTTQDVFGRGGAMDRNPFEEEAEGFVPEASVSAKGPERPISAEKLQAVLKAHSLDPAKVDMEYLGNMTEEEIEYNFERIEAARKQGTTMVDRIPFSEREGMSVRSLPDGKVNFAGRTFNTFKEALTAGKEVQGGERIEPIRTRPHETHLIVPSDFMQAVFPGADGVTFGSTGAALQYMGMSELRPKFTAAERNAPMMILSRDALTRQVVSHEQIHSLIDANEILVPEVIAPEYRKTAMSIAQWIGKGEDFIASYKNMNTHLLLEEVMAYGMAALRTGDREMIRRMAEADYSEQHVLNLFYDTAIRSYERAQDTAAGRMLQRKMADVIRRSSRDVTHGMADTGRAAYFDPTTENWHVRLSDSGKAYSFNTAEDAWKFLEMWDPLFMLPNYSGQLEAMGVKGPLYSARVRPGDNPPMPDKGISAKDNWWTGWMAGTAWTRPTGAWVASLDRRINGALGTGKESFKEFRGKIQEAAKAKAEEEAEYFARDAEQFQRTRRHLLPPPERGVMERVEGKKNLPLYDTFRKVDTGLRDGEKWLVKQYKDIGESLKGLSDEKMHDYFETLSRDPRDWPRMAQELGLTQEDTAALGRLREWMQTFRRDTGIIGASTVEDIQQHAGFMREVRRAPGIDALEYLRNTYHDLRNRNFVHDAVWNHAYDEKTASFWERAVRGEDTQFDPKDNHLGRFLSYIVRQGYEQKFVKDGLDEFQKVMYAKAKDGSYVIPGVVRAPLEKYVNYVKGYPDLTQRIINRFTGDVQSLMVSKFKQANKHLPSFAKLPEEFDAPQSTMNKFLILGYAMGLGARPAIFIRDALQVFLTSMPVLGPKQFFKGMTKALTPEGFEFAESAGALLTKRNIGELYGDITGELPIGQGGAMDKLMKFSNMLLSPSRSGHNVARAITFHGEYDQAIKALRQYRAGAINLDDLLNKTSLWFHDQPNMTRLLKMAENRAMDVREVAKQFALDTIDLTQWPYRRGAQPAALRTGLGRLFGQYGQWPMNYLDFVGRMGQKAISNPRKGAMMGAYWLATGYVANEMLEHIGIDSSKWFLFAPMSYGGSPYMDLAMNIGKAAEATQRRALGTETMEDRQVIRELLEFPLNFIPALTEIKGIIRTMHENESYWQNGKPGPGLLRVLGFKPVDPRAQFKGFL